MCSHTGTHGCHMPSSDDARRRAARHTMCCHHQHANETSCHPRGCRAQNVQPRFSRLYFSLFINDIIMPEGLPGTKRAPNFVIAMSEGGAFRHIYCASSAIMMRDDACMDIIVIYGPEVNGGQMRLFEPRVYSGAVGVFGFYLSTSPIFHIGDVPYYYDVHSHNKLPHALQNNAWLGADASPSRGAPCCIAALIL